MRNRSRDWIGWLAVCVLASFAAAGETPMTRPTDEIRLWDGPAPGVAADAPEEVVVNERIRNVTVPTIRAWLPDPARANGTAIIVCPGGGYAHLALKLHADAAAEYFVPQGIAVIALKYRLKPPATDPARDALADVRRAVRLVRSHAAEWKINPARVGVMGYSAGANATLNLLSHPDAPDANATDPLARVSSRPDFGILLATWPAGRPATDYPIAAGAPPTFIASVEDDKTAPVAFSTELQKAFESAGATVKHQTYPDGGHAGLHIGSQWPGAAWPEAMLPWLASQGLLKSNAPTTQP